MAEAARKLITAEEYLELTGEDEGKHELIEGVIYAMAPIRANHSLITSKLNKRLLVHLDGTPCQVYNDPMEVKIDDFSVYAPDVMVDCSKIDGKALYKEEPLLIVEVLSPSTRRHDKATKLRKYLTIPSLKEYALIEQDFVDVEILRRDNGWQPEHHFLGDDVTFTSIDLTLSVEDIYEWVQNNDMRAWSANKKEEEGKGEE